MILHVFPGKYRLHTISFDKEGFGIIRLGRFCAIIVMFCIANSLLYEVA